MNHSSPGGLDQSLMFQDRTFKDERVILDGARFVRCTFDGSILVYFGGQLPEMEECWFNDVQFSFEGPARNTLELLAKLKEKGVEVI